MSSALDPTRSTSRLSIRVTALCWFVVLLDGLDLFVFGAVLPRLLSEHAVGLTPVVAGEVASLTTFGMLLGALASGFVTDRLGRRMGLVLGVTVFSLASLATGLAPTLAVFGVARFVAGLGLGGLLPTAITMAMEYAAPRRKALSVAVVMTAHQAGGALAGTLGLALAASLGWRGVFMLGAVPLLVAVPALLAWLPESPSFLLARGRRSELAALAERHGVDVASLTPADEDRRSADVGLRALFAHGSRRATVLFWIASFFGLLLVYGMSTWLPTMMRSNGYELGSAVAFLVVVNLGGIVGLLIAGPLADRFGARPVAVIWFVLTAVGLCLLAVKMPLIATYAVVFFTGTWLFSAQTMIYAFVGASFGPSARGTALGWASGVGRVGAIVGPSLGGLLVASGASTWGFGVFAAAAVLGAVSTALVPRRRPVQAESREAVLA
ncbi:aromatic acid/H+ symport family MFS transporter [Actinomycetospora sp. TBRC 11914]|uniref:MFS transporter n=1 Tax=Actinomycetospora sp. TBRC 11914 TaxID=2729387 RepID=UPI00145F5F2E|nr:aromatic acid/H+ symport family MFS transporter [Actinomycetospora sp. TBRC 11914]NMO91728.1 aromatic acid/H+ symport family MFS transporter [Actinomycetospora sp. TBRC 11914]